MNDWVDLESVIEQTRGLRGWSSRAIDRKIKARQIVCRPLRQAGQVGRPGREIYIPSLPADVQKRIRGEQPSEPAPAALTAAPLNPRVATPPMQPIDEKSRTVANQRYCIITPFLDLCERGPVSFNGRTFRTRREIKKAISRQWGYSEQTIQRWADKYRKNGMLGLLDRPERSDKGLSRYFSRYADAAAFAAACYLDQRKLSVRLIHRLICEQRQRFGIPEDDLPSYETLRAHLNDREREVRVGKFAVTPAMRIMAREGLRAYQNNVAPYVKRAYVDVYANQIWVSDHKIADVEVRNDVFVELEIGAPLRPRFTAIMDFRSRKIVGFTFAVEGSSMSIVTAMRAPLVNYGPPETLYMDNGEDYRKIGREICPWLGIKPQFCERYHGQSKPIERQFGTMKEQFDILWNTFTGGKPELRPDQTTVEMARHRKLLRMGMLQHTNHPPASYFIGMAAAWIEEYNKSPHSGEGMDGATPDEVFLVCANPNQRPPMAREALVHTLVERRQRKVRECAITMGNRRYIGDGEAAVRKLHDLANEQVLIAYDPNDTAGAAVLTPTGQLICWVKPERPLPHSPEAKEAVAAMISQRKRLQNSTQDAIAEVHRLAAATGAENGLQMLEHKARLLPMAVGAELVTQRRTRVRPDDNAVAPPSAGDIVDRALQLEEE